MLTVLAIGASVLLVGWLAAHKRRATAASEGKRFVLRVEPEPGKTVRLGTSIETGAEPEHEPMLVAEEAAVLDDADHVVVIPAGQLLQVRAFEGGVRTALEAVTTASAAGRRYAFDVEPDRKFWILDAPGWRECLGTTDPRRRRLPPRAEGYEVTTRFPPVPARDERGLITVTMANQTRPLWMQGLERPEEWLLGVRASTEPSVAIAAFSDPHHATRSSTAPVGSACWQLADTVWLETTARAGTGVPIVVSRSRFCSSEPLCSWDRLTDWRQRFAPGTTFVWGAAGPSLESDGFEVRVRREADPAALELTGPLPDLRNQLVDALASHGIERAGAARALCRPIKPLPVELDRDYAAVAELLFVMLLGQPKTQALPVRGPETQRRIVDLAKELAEAAPESELGVLTWIVAAIFAHGCGGLSPQQRSAALAFVRTRTADDDPIARLAPAIFYRLGESGEAATAARAAIVWCSALTDAYRGALAADVAAYRTWLDNVLAKAEK